MSDSNKYSEIIDLKEDIAKWYNSSTYNKLCSTFQETDIFKILGVSRKEERHSKFIAWLLDPQGSHGLSDFPLRRFLQLLAISKNKYYNNKSEFPDNLENKFIIGNYSLNTRKIKVDTEFSIPARNKNTAKKADSKDRLDIFISNISLEDEAAENVFIIIENKVKSSEGDGQTQHYYDWSHGKLNDNIKLENYPPKGIPICVFLYPGAMNTQCDCNEYIKITYQDLADMVIEPCLLRSNSETTRLYISEYLKTLSYSIEDSKGELVMAFSKEEKELCEAFFEENKELLAYVTEVLNASDYDDDDFVNVSSYVKSQSSTNRDHTKYSFNGEGKYGKRKIALKIMQEASKTYDKLDSIKDVFKSVFEINPNLVVDDLKNFDEYRFFTQLDQTLSLDGKNYYLTNQWGKSNNDDGPFERLMKIARDDLKFDIKEIG